MPPKVPVRANYAPVVLTAMGSSAIGDKVGDALANVLTWLIQLACSCIPPAGVVSSFHTLCVTGTVGVACMIHYQFIKPKGDD